MLRAAAVDQLLFSNMWDPSLDLPPYATFTFSLKRNRFNFDAIGAFDDVKITEYTWDFGDGTVVSGRKKSRISHSYSSSGPEVLRIYTVTLTVTDSSNQETSFSQQLYF